MPDASVGRQLKAWVRGEPHHNAERDECCPDFSCCRPELLAPKEVREEFAAAGEEKRYQMLGMFLGAALDVAGRREEVHIVGVDGGPEA